MNKNHFILTNNQKIQRLWCLQFVLIHSILLIILPVTKLLWSCLNDNALLFLYWMPKAVKVVIQASDRLLKASSWTAVGCWPLHSQALHSYDAYFHLKAGLCDPLNQFSRHHSLCISLLKQPTLNSRRWLSRFDVPVLETPTSSGVAGQAASDGGRRLSASTASLPKPSQYFLVYSREMNKCGKI